MSSSSEEIVRELGSQGVVACRNISVRSQAGERRNTSTFILTFHTTTVPKHIHVADFLRVHVAVCIPNPLRCFICQKFGHAQNNCKCQKVCACCSTAGHDSKDCSNELKCANCDGDHAAFSKECPSWLREKKLQQVKAKSGLSFVEARKIVQSQAASRSRQSFAATASTRVQPAITQTSCVGTQTDLTWPDSQRASSSQYF